MEAKVKEMEASGNADSFKVREADILQRLVASSQSEGTFRLSDKEVVSCSQLHCIILTRTVIDRKYLHNIICGTRFVYAIDLDNICTHIITQKLPLARCPPPSDSSLSIKEINRKHMMRSAHDSLKLVIW